jgi:hypothetical protein
MAYEATATLTSMCNSFVQKYWTLVAPIHKIKNSFKSTLNEFETTLAGMVFSTTQEIANQLVDLEDHATALIPEDSVDAVREVQSFVNGCDCFFGTDDGGESAVGAVLGGLLGIYDQIDDYIGQITYPEFAAGAVANILNQMIDGAGLGLPYSNKIGDLLKRADCMVACMNSLCPATVATPEFQLILNDLQELYNILRLDDNPESPNYAKIKYDEIYTAAGISEAAIVNMESTITGIGDVIGEASRGIEGSVTAIKNAIKGGWF